MLSEQSQAIVVATGDGATYSEIGADFRISPQRVGAIVKSGRKLIDKAELDLMACRKTDEVLLFPIPYGPDYRVALDFADWVVSELHKRGEIFAVETRHTHNGLALFIDPIGGTEAASK